MADPLLVQTTQGLGLATVMARKGVAPKAIGDALSLDLRTAPGVHGHGGQVMVGTGPDSWLAVRADASPSFAQDLASQLAGLASVSDQSSGYVVLHLSGPAARTVLQRGAAIDFHDASFPAGAAAATMIAHIGVIIWREDETPAYHVALFRSFAASFQHWLAQTAAAL